MRTLKPKYIPFQVCVRARHGLIYIILSNELGYLRTQKISPFTDLYACVRWSYSARFDNSWKDISNCIPIMSLRLWSERVFMLRSRCGLATKILNDLYRSAREIPYNICTEKRLFETCKFSRWSLLHYRMPEVAASAGATSSVKYNNTTIAPKQMKYARQYGVNNMV